MTTDAIRDALFTLATFAAEQEAGMNNRAAMVTHEASCKKAEQEWDALFAVLRDILDAEGKLPVAPQGPHHLVIMARKWHEQILREIAEDETKGDSS